VEEEVFALCHTEAVDLMVMASKHPFIHLPVCTHHMVNRLMVLSSEQVAEAFHGVVVVVESLVVGEGPVVSSGNEKVAWGLSMEPNGDQSKFLGKYLLKVDPHYSFFSGRYEYSSLKTF